jgi:hypothetical protein
MYHFSLIKDYLMKRLILFFSILLMSQSVFAHEHGHDLDFQEIGVYGHYDDEGRFRDAIETCAWDDVNQLLLATCDYSYDHIDVINIDDPTNPYRVREMYSSTGEGSRCIAVYNGVVAMVLKNHIEFWNIKDNVLLKRVEVGEEADNIQFSPNGNYAVVANEGDEEGDDGPGSISIIDLRFGYENAFETNLDFSEYTYNGFFQQGFDSDNYNTDVWGYETGPIDIKERVLSSVYNQPNLLFYLITALNGKTVYQVETAEGYTYEGWYNENNTFENNGYVQDLNAGGDGCFVFKNMQNAENNPDNLGCYLDMETVDTEGRDMTLSFYYGHMALEEGDMFGYVIEYNDGDDWNMDNFVSLVDTENNFDEGGEEYNQANISIDGSAGKVRIRFYARYFGENEEKAAYVDEVIIQSGAGGPKVKDMYIPQEYLAKGSDGIEPEYVAISPDSRWAFVTLQENNAIAKVDIMNKKIVDVFVCGMLDLTNPRHYMNFHKYYNGELYPYRFHALKMPDGITSFRSNGQTYFIAVNEGEDGGFVERGKLRDVDDDIQGITGWDPDIFPNGSDDLTYPGDEPGRFLLDKNMVDTDNDGLIDRLVYLGGRNFTIYDINGNIVHEGETFDHHLPGTDDQRQMGHEPEGVSTGWIGDRHYAFMALERAHSVIIYDITDPTAPFFVDKCHTGARPEYSLFIPADKSPDGEHLIVITNEDSDVGISIVRGMPKSKSGKLLSEEAITGIDAKVGAQDMYYLTTGRGPVEFMENESASKFHNPAYKPKIILAKKTGADYEVMEEITLKMNGTELSGLPSMNVGAYNYTGENAVDMNGDPIVFYGESVYPASVADGGDYLWVGDNYGARILKVNKMNGEIEKIYSPYGEDAKLDSILKYHRKLRGISALDIDCEGKIWATTEVGCDLYFTGSNSLWMSKSRTQVSRLLELDPMTDMVNYYCLYTDDRPSVKGMAMLPNGDFVLITDDKDNENEDHRQFFYYAKPAPGDTIPAEAKGDLEQNSRNYRYQPWSQRPLYQLGYGNNFTFPYSDFEGIALSDMGRFLTVNYNNYGFAQFFIGDAMQVEEVGTILDEVYIVGEGYDYDNGTEFIVKWSDYSQPKLKMPHNWSGVTVEEGSNVELMWDMTMPGKTFTLQVAMDPMFEEVVMEMHGIEAHSYEIEGEMLQTGMEYFWRVAETDNCVWSATWAFMPVEPLTLNLEDISRCGGSEIQFHAMNMIEGGSGDFSVSWMPSGKFDNPHSMNPTVTDQFLRGEITLWVKDNMTMEEVTGSFNLEMNNPPSISTMGVFKIVPQNMAIDLNTIASASGGTAPYEIRFWDANSNRIQDPTNYMPVSVFNQVYIDVEDATGCEGPKWGMKRYLIIVLPNKLSEEDIMAGEYGTGVSAVFPNPADDKLNVEAFFYEESHVTAEIYDVLGNKISGIELGSAQEISTTLDVHNLTSGMYLLKLHTANDVIVNKFIVK